MKRHFYLFSVVLALILVASPLFGQAKIAYINSFDILSNFEEAKTVETKLQAEREKMTTELRGMQGAIDSLMAEYDKKQLIWSDQKKKQEQDRINGMYKDFQDAQMAKFGEQGELAKLQAQLMEPVLKKINDAIKEVGEEEGYDIIFDAVNANIVYAKEEQFNITQKVVDKLK